jgi:hypothetical protein
MYPQHAQIESILNANRRRAVVAVRDAHGVPHLSPVYVFDWDPDGVWFGKLPGTRFAAELRARPEVSVSVIDWAGFRGLQLKGLATAAPAPAAPQSPADLARLRGAGVREFFRVQVMEVYDAIPKAGADLGIPLWYRSRAWARTLDGGDFTAPPLAPLAMPAALARQADSFFASLRKRFVPSFVGTTGEDGVPNISPRFLLEAGGDYWFYGDGFRNKTFLNTARPSPLCIAAVDWDLERGYLAHGWAELRFTGDWLEKIRKGFAEIDFKVQAVQAVVFHPEDVEEIGVTGGRRVFTGRQRADWALRKAVA